MVATDFIVLKGSILQTLIVYVIVGIAITIGMGSAVSGAACISSMVVIMLYFVLGSFDEANAWQRFRAAFPLSRKGVVLGRYASILCLSIAACVLGFMMSELLVQAVSFGPLQGVSALLGPEVQTSLSVWSNPPSVLLAAAMLGSIASLGMLSFTLPVVMRFGLTRAARLVPMLILMAAIIGAMSLGQVWDMAWLGKMASWLSADPDIAFLQVIALSTVLALVLYAISAYVSIKLYERREF